MLIYETQSYNSKHSLRKEVLNLFHEQHLGIMRTKMLMRNYCWWPGMSDDIEKFIGLCDVCQYTQNFSNNNALLSWPKTTVNFYRVHIDFYTFISIRIHF